MQISPLHFYQTKIKQGISLLLFSCALVCLIPITGRTATFSPLAKTADGVEIHLEGEIQPGDAERLEANFERAKASGLRIIGMSLNSPGGKIAPGAAMARSIRARGLRTKVGDNATCASACFMLFAAGKERLSSDSARIGVHSAVVPQEGETSSAKSSTVDSARFLAELGVPPAIVGKMVTTKPEDISWLTRDDLRSMQVNMSPGQSRPGSYVEEATPPIRRETLPAVTTPADSQSAKALLSTAQSHLRAEQPTAAAELLKKASGLDPYDPFIASTYGYALHLSGSQQKAREALNLSLQIKKNFAEAYRVLGLVAVAQNDTGAARDSFAAYYRNSERPDIALSYLSSLTKSSKSDSILVNAVRAAFAQLKINP